MFSIFITKTNKNKNREIGVAFLILLRNPPWVWVHWGGFINFRPMGQSIISFWIFICQLRLNQNQKWNLKKNHTNMHYNMCSNGIVHTNILCIEMKKTTKIATRICSRAWLCQNMSHYHMQVSRLLFQQRLSFVLVVVITLIHF